MALQDLLESIVKEADQRIHDAKAAHTDRMHQMQTEQKAAIDRSRKSTEDRLNQRKRSLREKAESLGRISAGKLLLEKKNELLASVYDEVLSSLEKLPKDKLESFFKTCLAEVGDGEGEIRAAKQHEAILKDIAGKNLSFGKHLEKSAGGFTVSTDKREWNFTFDFLVHQALRPATDIETASKLFTA